MFSALLTAGCAGPERLPPEQPLQSDANQVGAVAFPPMVPAAPSVHGTAGEPAGRAASRVPKSPEKSSPPPVPNEHLQKHESTASGNAKRQQAPPLNLESLEARIRATEAIGTFTKLTLKDQIDDLLDRFRAFYQGRLRTTLAELRRHYDRLFLKVLALLQDADPQLADDIAASRNAIWNILADPAKFATV